MSEQEFENPLSAPSEPPLAGDGATARHVGSSGHPEDSQSLMAARDVELPDYITIDPHRGSLGETGVAHYWSCEPHRQSGTWIGQDDNAAAAQAEAIDHLDKLHPGWRTP